MLDFSIFLSLNGDAIYICAVDLFAECNSFGSPDIFCNAEIRPSGFLVNFADVASARNSLRLDTANCINLPNIGASIRNIKPHKHQYSISFTIIIIRVISSSDVEKTSCKYVRKHNDETEPLQ